MNRRGPSQPPSYVQEWAEAARHGNALRPWIRPRYWEGTPEREKSLKSDFKLALRALDQVAGPNSEMVRTGAWTLLDRYSSAAADELSNPSEGAVAWLLRAVLLPVYWEHVPHMGKGRLKEHWQQTVNHAKLLKRDLELFRPQIAYKHPGLATVAGLTQLHQLRRASIDPRTWLPPRVDHSGYFGGYRPPTGDETLHDLLTVLIVGLESNLAEDTPPSAAFPSQYGRKRDKPAGPLSDKKTQPQYPRRNFYMKSLEVISQDLHFPFDENPIAACAHDLLAAAGDIEAAEGCTATYVRLFFKKKQETRSPKKT